MDAHSESSSRAQPSRCQEGGKSYPKTLTRIALDIITDGDAQGACVVQQLVFYRQPSSCILFLNVYGERIWRAIAMGQFLPDVCLI